MRSMTNKQRGTATDDAPREYAVVPHPHNPSPAEAFLAESGISIWAIIGYWRGMGEDTARTAADYAIPVAEVEAAIAYYDRHRCQIDAHIAANDLYFE